MTLAKHSSKLKHSNIHRYSSNNSFLWWAHIFPIGINELMCIYVAIIATFLHMIQWRVDCVAALKCNGYGLGS